MKVIKYLVFPLDSTHIGPQMSEWTISNSFEFLWDSFGNGVLVIFPRRLTLEIIAFASDIHPLYKFITTTFNKIPYV